jgi:hypothetical protein
VMAATGGSAPSAHHGTTYYVDCANGSDTNSGTDPAHAWRTLAQASSVTYQAGDQILFRRGTTCDGVFAPHGSGTAGAPIVAGAYGTGAKPQIAGGGARAAIFLDNVQEWELHDLDVTDTGAPTTTDRRAGVFVLLTDYGIGHHYVIDDVSVHDVNGADFKDPDPSGGILFAVQGSVTPTAFSDVTIENSSVNDVDRTGIGTSSTWSYRPQDLDGSGSTFAPITHLTIINNHVTNVGGDGIVVENAVGALVLHNTVDGFNERSAGYNAGVWAWNSDHVLYEYNDVSNGHGTRDGMAYDIDGGNNGNIYQYNYSHDNRGGFLLVCNAAGMTTANNIFRYNVSIDDSNTSSPYGVITDACGASTTNTQVYGNTIVTNQADTAMVSDTGTGGVTFRDNIFDSTVPGGLPFLDTSNTYDDNLFSGISTLPANNTGAVYGNPDFVAANPTDPWDLRLAPDSPAIGAGTPIPGDVTRDFFGNTIPAVPSIGADTAN